MSPVLVVVPEVFLESGANEGFAIGDDAVQEISSESPNESFSHAVLPRTGQLGCYAIQVQNPANELPKGRTLRAPGRAIDGSKQVRLKKRKSPWQRIQEGGALGTSCMLEFLRT